MDISIAEGFLITWGVAGTISAVFFKRVADNFINKNSHITELLMDLATGTIKTTRDKDLYIVENDDIKMMFKKRRNKDDE